MLNDCAIFRADFGMRAMDIALDIDAKHLVSVLSTTIN